MDKIFDYNNVTFYKRELITEVFTMRLYQRSWKEIDAYLKPKESILINDDARLWIDMMIDVIETNLIKSCDIIHGSKLW